MAISAPQDLRLCPSASLSGLSVVLLAGPLQALHMSSMSPETPLLAPAATPKHGAARRKKPRRKHIEARSPALDAGFKFDVDFPAAGAAPADTHEPQDSHLKHSQQMATFFLASASAVRSRYNIMAAGPGNAAAPRSAAQGDKPVQISPAVRRRADQVKASLELKFTWIQRMAESAEAGPAPSPGLDRCYNPLQVLRNRVTRKKLHQPMPPPAAHPLPCDAFSSHPHVGSKPWKMLWGIDLGEFVADYAWRKAHWAQLRTPSGDLWYPGAALPRETTPRHGHASKKLHDRLWNDSDSSRSTDERLLLEIPFQSLGKQASAKGSRSHWRDRAKRLYGSRSSSAIDLRPSHDPQHAPLRSWDGLSAVKIARVGMASSADPSSQLHQFRLGSDGDFRAFMSEDHDPTDRDSREIDPIEVDPGQAYLYQVEPRLSNSKKQDSSLQGMATNGMLPPPLIVIDDGHSSTQQLNSDILEEDESDADETKDAAGNIHDVFFGSAHQKNPLVQHFEWSSVKLSTESIDEAGPPSALILDELQLRTVEKQLKRLNALSRLRHNMLGSVYPALLLSTSLKLSALLRDDMRRLLRSINQTNAGHLPARENIYKGYIEEAKSIMHLANDNCAVKIDNLLSATDRSYGELNTSLIMELRRTNEKLDKLSRSFFGGVMGGSTIADQEDQIYDITSHKLLYIALENVIVVFLRLVWIGANICKPVFVFMKFIWKMLTLLFRAPHV
ncbi:hypothetical protein METBIDRAFT_13916 [Metschnikowia bicuspidata var. bicuspidata NRRL YB-4993]|uniref:Uncharacterized protein n=1 Tax=Metschnikowia bicuspidata var. bicuspidata NRRL YB-4993 TaxID=869754 RepID=A0A1A0H252_9ASCO|nr:hypothetical protein METBIDRAFT_13916 [Metschnikowia bicuspidata var. bicuspidata NRRL YB-4993]OBA18002.1 hypothetical protein METBIDRAFT_13916 [Metschnikowia bicuspidata var. bicuspidata NRRL YB-4993]